MGLLKTSRNEPVTVKGKDGLLKKILENERFIPKPPFLATDVETEFIPENVDHQDVHFKGESAEKKKEVEAKFFFPATIESSSEKVITKKTKKKVK